MKIKDKIKKKLKPGRRAELKNAGPEKRRSNDRKEKPGRKRDGYEKRAGGEPFEPEDAEEFERRKKVILDLMNDKNYVPMKVKELAILLDIPKEKRRELKAVLEALLKDGKLSLSSKGKLGKPETFSITGTFSGHPKGFGFVTVEGRDSDVFIPGDRTRGAMHGDRVQIVIEEEEGGRRAEGCVIRVLEHANESLVGTYEKSKGFGFVIPDNQKISKDIFIPQGSDAGAVTGHKVVVKIKEFGDDKGKKPEGVITEILGHINDPGIDILSIVRAYDLPEEFPGQVMEQLKTIPDEVMPEELLARKDLRDLKTVTIDGEEAKDLDDAITLVKKGNGYELGVHIADVSHYVREHTPLDTEALKRGTSVYLTDRVIPMLPHKLSNGICSLNQGEDRLALSCLMEIDDKGMVVGHEVAETVIRVDRRMTYTAVNAVITDRNPEAMEEYREFVGMFDLMKELADILRNRRHSRGSIDFDFPESKIILDEKGHPVEIKPYERNAATRLIEDFMLLANETVAEDFFWQEVPFLYRTHDKPDEEKMKKLGTFINNFGYILRMPNGEVHPKEVQKLLDKVENTPEEALISRLTLRSMKQAKYTTLNSGHFGLAAKYYTHFTSPIRRYPDLQIHRIIKECLCGKLDDRRVSHYEKILPEVAVKTSALERRADEAERETDKMKKVQYMEQFIGQEFDGVISGVTNWGFYVELPSTVEGLVHINELRDDYYLFDELHYELIGEMTRKTYKLGQPIRVQVTGCDRFAKTIDFIPAGNVNTAK
ncbi:ribonuclease R [[Clostridium] symbiosum]|nr:ribonuclease R [[Clostridium] symbiosum]MCB6609825.1 ribonuclease R [[Clostridium] symbiosum]MCB6933250.1 ribonuclease R [[Clostridium] symbiosum]